MFHFYAMIFRMRSIQRWGLMRSVQPENLAEHALLVSLLAHGLASIRQDVFGGTANPDRVAVLALLHDAGEIVTGDMPTPIKYHNPQLRAAYAQVEAQAIEDLITLLPFEMQPRYRMMMQTATMSEEDAVFVHAADKLAAHIKCVEELSAGNREFAKAGAQTLQKLQEMQLPELDYFMTHFLPSFSLTLDEQELR